MDDADQLHATLALVARGVQRMADSFGAIEQRLERLEATAATSTGTTRDDQVGRLVEAVRGLRDDLAIATRQLEAKIADQQPAVVDAPAPAPSPDTVEVDRLVEAVRALRDDLAAATTQLQSETTATVERSANEHGARLAQLRDAIIEMRDAIAVDLAQLPASAAPAPVDDSEVRSLVAEVRDALQAVHGEIVAGSGQLRTDLAAEQATLRDRLLEAVTGLPASPHAAAELVARFEAIDVALAAVRADIAAATAPIDAPDPLEPRLIAIEAAVTHLRDDFAIDKLELSLRQMGGELERVSSDTSGLRNDVRAVLHEVKAIDDRLGGMGEELRLVRGLRDGLEALASGVDAVRVLASKGATSQQMGELGRDLTSLLAEIESARSQVLAVDQQVSQPGAIDVTPAIQRLEQAVGDDVDELGRRIEQLAAAVEAQQQHATDDVPDVSEAIASRLRGLATGARQLGLGISEDLRSRSRKKKSRSR